MLSLYLFVDLDTIFAELLSSAFKAVSLEHSNGNEHGNENGHSCGNGNGNGMGMGMEWEWEWNGNGNGIVMGME